MHTMLPHAPNAKSHKGISLQGSLCETVGFNSAWRLILLDIIQNFQGVPTRSTANSGKSIEISNLKKNEKIVLLNMVSAGPSSCGSYTLTSLSGQSLTQCTTS